MSPWFAPAFALLTLAMLASLSRKATQATSSMELRDRLQVTPALWAVIGGLEGLAVLGLGLGLVQPALGAAAAVGTGLLMAGAAVAHLRVGLGGRALLAPAVLLGFAVATAIGFATA